MSFYPEVKPIPIVDRPISFISIDFKVFEKHKCCTNQIMQDAFTFCILQFYKKIDVTQNKVKYSERMHL